MTLRIRMLAPLAIAAACGGEAPPPAEELTIPVRVAQPQLRDAEPIIELTGILGAKEEIPLGFKVGGVVATVAAEDGDRVRAGQLLASLSLTEIEAQVAAAREGRDKARRDLARAEALFRDSVATIAQLEDARTGLEVAEAQLRAAEFNRKYSEVRAPAAGTLLRRQVEAGQLVGPGTPVFVMRSDSKGTVLRAAAADRDAVRIRDGMTATLRFDAFPADSFRGRVERVGVASNPMTGTYEVEIALVSPPPSLVSGLIGRATLAPRRGSPLPMIPAEALLEVDGDSATIFTLAADDAARVARRRVRVLWLDGAMAALAGGVDSTTRVITAGAHRLTDSSRVRIAERAP